MARKETDIQIGGRFWSTTVDGKIVDASQVDGLENALNLNLKNGAGAGSLEQLLDDSGERWNVAEGAYSVALGQQGKAYGRGSISLGNSSKAGYTYEEWLGLKGLEDTEENHSAFLEDADNRYQVVIGQSTQALGKDSFAGGHSAIAKGNMSFAFGVDAGSNDSELIHTAAEGENSFAFGKGVKAVGENSFAIGETTNAFGKRATAIGAATLSSGENSFAGGARAKATRYNSFSFGTVTEANGEGSSAFGYYTKAEGDYSVAFGRITNAIGESSFAIGTNTQAQGKDSFAGGYSAIAKGRVSFAFGDSVQANNTAAISVGLSTKAEGAYSAAFGHGTVSGGTSSFAINEQSQAKGDNSFAGGEQSIAEGKNSFAFGTTSKATGSNSIAIGYKANATGEGAIAIGNADSTAKGSIAIGKGSLSAAEDSIAIGWNSPSYPNRALGKYCLALGVGNTVEGKNTYKIGYHNKSNASGENVISLGFNNTTGGSKNIFQLGDHLISNYPNTVALGFYNLDKWMDDIKDGLLLSIGNGTDGSNRSNALELKRNGDLWVAGKMTVSADPTEDNDVVNKRYMNDNLKTLLQLIDGLTDKQINALNSFAKTLTEVEV